MSDQKGILQYFFFNIADLHIDDATRDQAHASESRATVSGSDMGSSERDGGAKDSDSDMDISKDEADTEKNLITVNGKNSKNNKGKFPLFSCSFSAKNIAKQ